MHCRYRRCHPLYIRLVMAHARTTTGMHGLTIWSEEASISQIQAIRAASSKSLVKAYNPDLQNNNSTSLDYWIATRTVASPHQHASTHQSIRTDGPNRHRRARSHRSTTDPTTGSKQGSSARTDLSGRARRPRAHATASHDRAACALSHLPFACEGQSKFPACRQWSKRLLGS